ncbi:fluoride efflux transporter CrcB [Lampropedia aestuarii]|uniref:fluoride efflux transporter CrcB n=1 Tax=Lampropedia aestuarii TaxID=2562762 RepID=UPI0024695CEA|nr:fluoride efflux transporter CrcB [Lampropedia aestuarii]MDH5856100.1 fluoride efflux transporter CrcB [Lampropedia aestuarii]
MSTALSWSGVGLVAVGGAMGAVSRYALSDKVAQWALTLSPTTRFPWGTWSVNLLGCLIMGVLAGLALRHAWFDTPMRLLLMTGLMGGFTTFSSFGLETLDLVLDKHWGLALSYSISSLLLGVLAAVLGMALGAGSAGFSR